MAGKMGLGWDGCLSTVDPPFYQNTWRNRVMPWPYARIHGRLGYMAVSMIER